MHKIHSASNCREMVTNSKRKEFRIIFAVNTLSQSNWSSSNYGLHPIFEENHLVKMHVPLEGIILLHKLIFPYP